MSSNLMDTEPGGMGDGYEDAIKTVTEPHKKSGGQLGEPSTSFPSESGPTAQEKSDRGAQTAENIRYGQNMSENGMGGKTTTSSGSAGQDNGQGGAEYGGSTADAVGARKAAGYGGDKDMDREIGA